MEDVHEGRNGKTPAAPRSSVVFLVSVIPLCPEHPLSAGFAGLVNSNQDDGYKQAAYSLFSFMSSPSVSIQVRVGPRN